MSKHTPGPWVVKDDGGGLYIMAGEIDIATAVGPFAKGQQQEAEANAGLIASAPELLKALHLAVTTLRAAGVDEHDRSLIQADLVISMVEGRG